MHGTCRATGIHGTCRATGMHGTCRATGMHGTCRATGMHGTCRATGMHGTCWALECMAHAGLSGCHMEQQDGAHSLLCKFYNIKHLI